MVSDGGGGGRVRRERERTGLLNHCANKILTLSLSFNGIVIE